MAKITVHGGASSTEALPAVVDGGVPPVVPGMESRGEDQPAATTPDGGESPSLGSSSSTSQGKPETSEPKSRPKGRLRAPAAVNPSKRAPVANGIVDSTAGLGAGAE